MCVCVCMYVCMYVNIYISSVQFSSVTQSCPTLCNPMNRSMPGLHVYNQLLESTQTRVHWVSDAMQPSHPLSSPSPPALNLSEHQSFQMSQLFASGGISPSNQHPGLISFRMNWLDLLAVQGTLKSLLQHHIYIYIWSYNQAKYYSSHVHSYPCVCVESWLKMFIFRTFEVYDTVFLIIIIRLYFRSPEFTHPNNWMFILFDQHLSISLIPQLFLSGFMGFPWWLRW